MRLPERFVSTAVAATLLIVVAPAAHAAPLPHAASEQGPPASAQLIIETTGGASLDEVLADARLGLDVGLAVFEESTSLGANVVVLSDADGSEEATFRSRISTDQRVESVEDDGFAMPSIEEENAENSEDVQGQAYEDLFAWNLTQFTVPWMWGISAGQGSVVAVVDTGWVPHPDIVDSVLPGVDMVKDTALARDGDGRDLDPFDEGDWVDPDYCYEGAPARASTFHGTTMAGTVVGNGVNPFAIVGVSPGADFIPVRVSSACGARTSDVADGIVWAAGGNVDGLPDNPNPADVINISLSLKASCSPTYQDAIDTANELGAHVVVSAGNHEAEADAYSPGNCDGVITVGGLTSDMMVAESSNIGKVVDVYGPSGDASEGIGAIAIEGNQQPDWPSYRYRSGTSVAAASVSGAIALIDGAYPELSRQQQREALLSGPVRGIPQRRGNFRPYTMKNAVKFIERKEMAPPRGPKAPHTSTRAVAHAHGHSK